MSKSSDPGTWEPRCGSHSRYQTGERNEQTMRSAASVVARMARKYDCNKTWIWELLDESFNMRKGEAAVMDQSEIEALKDIIEELIDT